jgi:23S rRNA (guanosine2251-2'-O)-methyltransferase
VRGGVRPTGPRPNRFGSGSPAGAGAGRQPPWRQPQTEEGWANPAPQLELVRPDEELVAGRRPVEEAFVAKRPARRLLVVPQRRQALERLVLHATSLRIPVVEVEGGSLTAVAGFDGHQGIALVVEPRTWASLDDILARSKERSEPPFVLVLDSLEDPQNVGTLLRSAEAAGIHGVIFPTHRQAPLTPAAVKASAGAVEHLLLCPVDDLPGAMSDLRLRGLRIAAADADASLTTNEADLRGPLAIVVGSEGQGLSPAVRRRADVAIRIPMRGAIGSLNAAVAGSILLFAALAQREPDGSARPPTSEGAATASAAAQDVATPSAEPDVGMEASPAPVARDEASGTPIAPEPADAAQPTTRRRRTARTKASTSKATPEASVAAASEPAPDPPEGSAEPADEASTGPAGEPAGSRPPRRRRLSKAIGADAAARPSEVPSTPAPARARTRRTSVAMDVDARAVEPPGDRADGPDLSDDLLPGGPRGG